MLSDVPNCCRKHAEMDRAPFLQLEVLRHIVEMN